MNIYEAITKIMEEGYSISKSKRNAQQGFMYRGIDDVMNTFQPLMAKYHIFVAPTVLEQTREVRTTNKGSELLYSVLRIRYTFYAEDGTSVDAVVIGEGMDSGDKASNKAMAVGMKYAMFQTFCIPTEEMSDPDAETPPPSVSKPRYNQAIPEDAVQISCADCGSVVDQRVHDFSVKRYGRPLCRDCQRRVSAGV